MRGRYRLRQSAPGFAGGEAAIKRDRRRAGVHDVGPGRINRKRPDHDAAIGKTEPLPVIATVGATVRAVLRSGEDHIRVMRMHEEDMDLRVFRKPRSQRLPPIFSGGVAEQPAAQRGALAGGAGPCAGEDLGVGVLQGVAPLTALMRYYAEKRQ